MTQSSGEWFVVHADDSEESLLTQGLLEGFRLPFMVVQERSDEWSTVPAVYRVANGVRELVGGYNELCDLLNEA
jgi:hypothetical protein